MPLTNKQIAHQAVKGEIGWRRLQSMKGFFHSRAHLSLAGKLIDLAYSVQHLAALRLDNDFSDWEWCFAFLWFGQLLARLEQVISPIFAH